MKKSNAAVKKVLSLVLGLMMVMGLAMPVRVSANDGISVTIEGERVHFQGQQPVVVDGRTLVPVRAVFETLGWAVNWDGATSTAVIIAGDDEMRITIGSNIFTFNDASHTLDVPAQIIGGSTMVPLRLPLERLGYHLDWDSGTSTVRISRTPFGGATTAPPAPVAPPLGDIPAYITIQGQQFSTALTYLRFANPHRIMLTNEDIVQLRYMVNLTHLYLMGDLKHGENHDFSDITPLAGLTNLVRLGLAGCGQLSDISPLAGLTNLEVLDLSVNEISDLSPLAGLTNLESLWLDANPISDVSPLAGLTNLSVLGLYYTQISDVSPLAGLTNLTRLYLVGNPITDRSPLNHLPADITWEW